MTEKENAVANANAQWKTFVSEIRLEYLMKNQKFYEFLNEMNVTGAGAWYWECGKTDRDYDMAELQFDTYDRLAYNKRGGAYFFNPEYGDRLEADDLGEKFGFTVQDHKNFGLLLNNHFHIVEIVEEIVQAKRRDDHLETKRKMLGRTIVDVILECGTDYMILDDGQKVGL